MIPYFTTPLYITKPILPNLKDYHKILQQVWDSNILTNHGSHEQNLEEALLKYLGVENLSLFCNGTIALLIACKVLRLTGEVITTPFTFPATSHALSWAGIEPVFCDIDKKSLNIDPRYIEKYITDRTTAILPVHVFGEPCDTEKIQEIADKHNLKVLYDAAHAFDVSINGESVLNFGDCSMLSFHATKIFHTAEGGGLVFKQKSLKERADTLKNFGIVSEESIIASGINGKMSELHAALGELVLPLVKQEIKRRKELYELYLDFLHMCSGVEFIKKKDHVKYNYQYLPILTEDRDALYSYLKYNNVHTRKYFYPLLSEINTYYNKTPKEDLKNAVNIANRILVLPLTSSMTEEDVFSICSLIKQFKDKHYR